MPSLRPVAFLCALLSAIFVGLCNANLHHRAEVCTFLCPLTDNNYSPLGWGSGPSNNTLRCNYPNVYRCIYDALSGALLRDYDEGLCYTRAICTSSLCDSYQCPSDQGNYLLGAGTQRIGPTLVCVLPTIRQTNDTSAFCNYSMSTGALVYEYDGGGCPRHATSQACTTLPTAIATVTSTPTAAITKAKTVTIAVGTTLGVVVIAVSCLIAFLLYTRRKLKTIDNNNKWNAVTGAPPTSFPLNETLYPGQRIDAYHYGQLARSPAEGTYPHLPEI